MANPNDINASILLEDKTSAVLKKVDDNTKKTADAITKEMGKTKSVFDKFNAGINLTSLAMKGLQAVARAMPEVGIFQENFIASLTGEVRKLAGSFELLRDSGAFLFDMFADSARDDRKRIVDEDLEYVQKQLADPTLAKRLSDAVGKAILPEGLLSQEQVAKVFDQLERQLQSKRISLALQGVFKGIGPESGKALADNIGKVASEMKGSADSAGVLADTLEVVEVESEKIAENVEEIRLGFIDGFKSVTDGLGDMVAIGRESAQLLSSSFSQFFFDSFEQRTFRAADLLKRLLGGAAKIFFDQAGLGLTSAIGNFFPGSSTVNAPVSGGSGSSGAIGAAPVYNVNINAVDAQSFEALAVRNPRAIAAAVQAQLSSSPQFRTAVSRA